VFAMCRVHEAKLVRGDYAANLITQNAVELLS